MFLASINLAACSEQVQTDRDGGASDVADVLPGLSAFPLVDPSFWTIVTADDDPFDDRPATFTCSTTDGYGTEDLLGEMVFAIDLVFCEYATAHQPLTIDLLPGDRITFRVWHFELTGTTEAHVALTIGDQDLLDIRIPQPRDAQLLSETIVLDKKIDAGTGIFFHVHNHGANEYSIIDVIVDRD